MDITEGEVYNNTIEVQLKTKNELWAIRRMVRMQEENLSYSSRFDLKEFLKKIYRIDWLKMKYADRQYWFEMLDLLIDHCDTHDTINFVYTDKEDE